MGFTIPCFIRKNTPELQAALEILGYKTTTRTDFKGIKINEPEANGIYRTVYTYCVTTEMAEKYGYIDCGTNESLFIALAAKRDDTSDNQYWVFDEDFYKWKKGDFVIGRFGRCSCYCHVATVEELIEHFASEKTL